MEQPPASRSKRPHPDEVVVLDDSDDEEQLKATDTALASQPATTVPVLPHVDSKPPAAAASPTSKRVRADAEPRPQPPATPTASHASPASAPSTPRSSSSTAAACARPPTARTASVQPSPSPPPAISSYAFTGLYQPHRFIADDTDENKYVIAAAYVLSVTLKWNDSQTSAALQGRISWRYGLMWLNFDALSDDRQTLFWDVARQSEIITGQALREHERRGGSGGSGSVERVRLVMATRELLPIDASMSQFHDEAGDDDDTANQVQYTLEQFERERRYMLEVQDDGKLTGCISMQMQPTFGERKEDADEGEEEGRDTQIVGWPCGESDVDTSDELQPLQRMYRSFVARMHAVLTTQRVAGDVVGKLRAMLDRVLREPEVEGGKYRRVNRTTVGYKFGEGVVEVLKLCGFVEDEVKHMSQKFLVLPDDADLFLVATMRRALPS